MQLYSININLGIPKTVYFNLLDQVSLDKKAKLTKYIHFSDFKRGLISDLLIRYLIGNTFNLSNDEIEFGIGIHGKPFLIGFSDFQFNLSHSGQWVVCAVDQLPVGVDVEEMLPMDIQSVEKFFSIEEQRYLNNFSGIERHEQFYNLWTLKESYIKKIGKGLTVPLDSFTIDFQGSSPQLINVQEDNNSFLKNYHLTEDYKLSLCCSSIPSINSVNQIEAQKLLEWFNIRN
jgi:4'-phosphopantetheinyl transferase